MSLADYDFSPIKHTASMVFRAQKNEGLLYYVRGYYEKVGNDGDERRPDELRVFISGYGAITAAYFNRTATFSVTVETNKTFCDGDQHMFKLKKDGKQIRLTVDGVHGSSPVGDERRKQHRRTSLYFGGLSGGWPHISFALLFDRSILYM